MARKHKPKVQKIEYKEPPNIYGRKETLCTTNNEIYPSRRKARKATGLHYSNLKMIMQYERGK